VGGEVESRSATCLNAHSVSVGFGKESEKWITEGSVGRGSLFLGKVTSAHQQPFHVNARPTCSDHRHPHIRPHPSSIVTIATIPPAGSRLPNRQNANLAP
jgi:hypothetical protein